MLKKIFAFVALIALLNFSVAFAAQNDDATDSSSKAPVQSSLSMSVVDTTNTLTSSEIKSLNNKIRRVEMAHNVRVGIEFLKNTHGQSVGGTAESLLAKNFSGAPNGGILLLVVMDTRKWQIATDSVMMSAISNRDTERIAQNFLPYLSDGNYYTACEDFIDNVDLYLTSHENGTTVDEQGFNPVALMGAVLCAIVIAAIFRSSLIGSMSNVSPATSARNYLDKNSVKMNQSRDTYLFTKVTRRRKGGGRSGGGSSGGGGRSGGGSGGSF